jgi:hypothetical protein
MRLGLKPGYDREVYGWPGGLLEAKNPADLGIVGISLAGAAGFLKAIVGSRAGILRQHTPDPSGGFRQTVVTGSLNSGLRVHGVEVGYVTEVVISTVGVVQEMTIALSDLPYVSGMRSARIALKYGTDALHRCLPEHMAATVDMWDGFRQFLQITWSDCQKLIAQSRIVESFSGEAAPLSSWESPSTQVVRTSLPKALLQVAPVGSTVPLVSDRVMRLGNGRVLAKGSGGGEHFHVERWTGSSRLLIDRGLVMPEVQMRRVIFPNQTDAFIVLGDGDAKHEKITIEWHHTSKALGGRSP